MQTDTSSFGGRNSAFDCDQKGQNVFDCWAETSNEAGHASISKESDDHSARFPKLLFETRDPGRFGLSASIQQAKSDPSQNVRVERANCTFPATTNCFLLSNYY
jgi:hypothetical protein